MQTAGFVIESSKEYSNEELLVTTEADIVSNDTTSNENSAEIEES